MARRLNLSRHCLGLEARIECALRPLAEAPGCWVLFCAAGMAHAQPSAIRVQGPFHGLAEGEAVLAAITQHLLLQGYVESDEPSIWSLHMQAELRRLNAEYARQRGDCQFRPET